MYRESFRALSVPVSSAEPPGCQEEGAHRPPLARRSQKASVRRGVRRVRVWLCGCVVCFSWC